MKCGADRSDMSVHRSCFKFASIHWALMGQMSAKSRESIYGSTIRHSAERAKEARKEADKLTCEAWNYRMLGYKGPASPLRHWAMLLTRATEISRSGVSAAIPIRQSRWAPL